MKPVNSRMLATPCTDELPEQESSSQRRLISLGSDGEQQLSHLLMRGMDLLAEAKELPDVKEFRNRAKGAQEYARSAALSLEMLNGISELKLRAERKAGQLLAALHLRGGDRRSKFPRDTLKLGELGITRKQSQRWQLLASIRDAIFEECVDRCKASGEELTLAGVLRLARRLGCAGLDRDRGERLAKGFLGVAQGLADLIEKAHRYVCIYVRPPWPNDRRRRRQETHWLAELKKLPVREVASENAHLHLYATGRQLEDGMQLLRSWGFVYRSVLVIKCQTRYSEYWRTLHSFLLLGVRGDLQFRDNGMLGSVTADAAGSSEADSIPELLERVSQPPYLEIFGRHERDGWTVLMRE